MLHQHFRLQQWLQSSTARLTQYKFQYSPANNEIYHLHNRIISHHYTCNHTRNSVSISKDTEDYCSLLPKDCIPIDPVIRTTFKVFDNHKVSTHQSKADYSFKSSISMQPRWIQTLISNHTLSKKISLLETIVNSDPIRISTDGSKATLKSGGWWMVATKPGEHLATSYLPIFGQQKCIHSYQTEIHASLASIIFFIYSQTIILLTY